jgi:hypothetical protein
MVLLRDYPFISFDCSYMVSIGGGIPRILAIGCHFGSAFLLLIVTCVAANVLATWLAITRETSSMSTGAPNLKFLMLIASC